MFLIYSSSAVDVDVAVAVHVLIDLREKNPRVIFQSQHIKPIQEKGIDRV